VNTIVSFADVLPWFARTILAQVSASE